MPKFYLTTPIYYVNARPHIGHTYTTIVADTIARYKRMRGFDVIFLTGTDEHGTKVDRSARAAGKDPQRFADEISAEYRRLFAALDLRFDRFIRTTELRHERAVHRLFLKARDEGYVYKGHYEGQYCVFDELYVDDPAPAAPCPECGRPTERIREENYYFKLSAFQDRLLALYQQQPDFIQPESRRNEVISFVRGGLRDLSISRTSFKWGVSWPDDPEHVFYVWYDALTSYMSGIGYGDDELQWEKYWPADLHLIGKEILRFHAVYWPAFLMAAEEPLPRQIFAHGWWMMEMEKISKSRGNIARPQPFVQVLGVDALRYYLLREMVFGQDSNFSREAIITRYNADLANGLGNLASRTIAMVGKYCESRIPPQPTRPVPASSLEIRWIAEAQIRNALECFDEYAFSRALESIWFLLGAVDKYLTGTKPWAIAEDESNRNQLDTILYTASEAVRIICALAHPVIPHATEKIWRQLGQFAPLEKLQLDELAWGQLQAGTAVGEPEAVFPRADKAEALERIAAAEAELDAQLAGKPSPAAAAPAEKAKEARSNMITIDDFTKVEMKVGEIKSAERVPNADKLLKVMVDVGDEVRQVVAGIAEVYQPEQIVGRKVIVVTNLAPRKLRGVESNGMIVAASVGPDGKPVLATFIEDVPSGSRLK